MNILGKSFFAPAMGIFLFITNVHAAKNAELPSSSSQSGLVKDQKSTPCPDPIILDEIAKKFRSVQQEPESEKRMSEFTASLSPLLKSYDCRRSQDKEPVPAWWVYQALGRGEPEAWFKFVYESDLEAAEKFIGSREFKSTLDGALWEEFDLAFMHNRRVEKIRTAKLLKTNPPLAGLVLSDGQTLVPAFVYDQHRWIRFNQELPSVKEDWHIVFDGKAQEKIALLAAQKVITGSDSYPPFRLASSHAEVPLKSPFTGLAKIRAMEDAQFGQRPLLATNKKVSDPDRWKPVDPVPADLIAMVMKAVGTEVSLNVGCAERPGLSAESVIKEKLRLATSGSRKLHFANAKKEYLLQLELPSWKDEKSQKNCSLHSELGSRLAYFISADKKVTVIGGDVNMIDAADLDGDGASELVLSGTFISELAPEYSMHGAILFSTKTLKGPVLHWPSEWRKK